MSESILTSTKKLLGIDDEYTVYDLDIMIYINSAFGTLHQLGIGPIDGFAIESKTETWEDFLADDPRYSSIKQFVVLKVKQVFDPPDSSYAVAAMEKQIEELTWRLNIVREGDSWLDPAPIALTDPNW